MSRIANLFQAFKNSSTYNRGDCYRYTVASRRCVQNMYEEGIRQNPDDFVKHLLSQEEIGHALAELEGLRTWSFYHYLLARTRHFDQVFREALEQGVRQIILFGSGWDTRAYRFAGLLRERKISVLETDLPEAIEEKENRVRSLGNYDYVKFLPLDLRAVDYDAWLKRADLDCSAKTLFLAEGVSEYLDFPSVRKWLLFMSRHFANSTLTYDGSVARMSHRIVRLVKKNAPFSLPGGKRGVERFHRPLGLRTVAVYNSPQLQARYLQYEHAQVWNNHITVVLDNIP
jgi:methyltransferase (TIGR00027 family)